MKIAIVGSGISGLTCAQLPGSSSTCSTATGSSAWRAGRD